MQIIIWISCSGTHYNQFLNSICYRQTSTWIIVCCTLQRRLQLYAVLVCSSNLRKNCAHSGEVPYGRALRLRNFNTIWFWMDFFTSVPTIL